MLLHSSLSRLIRANLKNGIRLDVEGILDSFIEVVGGDGTLVLPLFNFGFAEGKAFDMRTTPSKMGVMTEVARKRTSAVRTGHPIYSFAALGRKAGEFADVENYSGYGADSPFALLVRLDAKIAVLDLPDQNSMTMYHHAEEMENVDYRYHKTFTGPCTTLEGDTTDRSFGLFVRDIERGVLTDVHGMQERLWELGLYEGDRPREGMGLRTIRARSVYDATVDVIRSGRALGMLYRLETSPS